MSPRPFDVVPAWFRRLLICAAVAGFVLSPLFKAAS